MSVALGVVVGILSATIGAAGWLAVKYQKEMSE